MMKKRYSSLEGGGCRNWTIPFGIMCASTLLAYAFFSPYFVASKSAKKVDVLEASDSCCRGVENLELWGRVVERGDRFYTNSTQECCRACKEICTDSGGCRCNSWVFCGDKLHCGDRFGQCWLKYQNDPLEPEIQASGKHVMWTSGLVYDDQDTGVLGIETQHGTIRIKLFVDCAPYSVAYILELKKLRHCIGCHLFRAEGRGSSWNEEGDQIGQKISGPYGLVQGTLAVDTVAFKELPKESCPVVQRGSIGWIGGGPDFFISLANHNEWYPKHTIFAKVFEQDMHIVEKIANLPTSGTTWSGVDVALLQQTIPVKFVTANTQVLFS